MRFHCPESYIKQHACCLLFLSGVACFCWTDPWDSPVYTIHLFCHFTHVVWMTFWWYFWYDCVCTVSLYIWFFLYHTQVGICMAVVQYSSRGGMGQQLHCVVTVQLYLFRTWSCKRCLVKFVVFATKLKLKISWDSHVMSEHFLYDSSSRVTWGLKIT